MSPCATRRSSIENFSKLGAHLSTSGSPGKTPTRGTYHQALTQARIQQIRDGKTGQLSPPAPGDVPFPRDPLRRLIGQHATSVDAATGAVYQSPWPRVDARPR